MNEIITAIALWVSNYTYGQREEYQKKVLICVTEDLRPGDWENKKYLSRKLTECLKK